MSEPVAREFTEQAVRHLESDFLPKIEVCLERLSEAHVWWRPNERSNSVGNLLMHLAGNLRQWTVATLGGERDVRQRDLEFSQREPIPKQELLQRLRETVAEAAAVIRRLGEKELLDRYHVQIYEVSGLQAVFHVVEHFSYHTGQIILVTKQLENVDLAFYGDLESKKKRFEETA